MYISARLRLYMIPPTRFSSTSLSNSLRFSKCAVMEFRPTASFSQDWQSVQPGVGATLGLRDLQVEPGFESPQTDCEATGSMTSQESHGHALLRFWMTCVMVGSIQDYAVGNPCAQQAAETRGRINSTTRWQGK